MPQTSCTTAPTHVCVELRTPGLEAAQFEANLDQPLLRSALDANLLMPSSCHNGTCRACISQLHSGKVSYRIEWPGLFAEEKARGLFLPCVAYPLTDLVMSTGDPQP